MTNSILITLSIIALSPHGATFSQVKRSRTDPTLRNQVQRDFAYADTLVAEAQRLMVLHQDLPRAESLLLHASTLSLYDSAPNEVLASLYESLGRFEDARSRLAKVVYPEAGVSSSRAKQPMVLYRYALICRTTLRFTEEKSVLSKIGGESPFDKVMVAVKDADSGGSQEMRVLLLEEAIKLRPQDDALVAKLVRARQLRDADAARALVKAKLGPGGVIKP